VESSLFSLTNSHTHPDDASNLISDGERRRIESPRKMRVKWHHHHIRAHTSTTLLSLSLTGRERERCVSVGCRGVMENQITRAEPGKAARDQSSAVLGASTLLMKLPPEIRRRIHLTLCATTSSLMTGPYREPHPDSEVNSLWSMEQCDQGKSARSMRNFGRSIGSKG
jgi:hypothetical protein